MHSLPNHSQPQRGFTLTEVAIVLGIVGLVIGGIWTTLTSVSEERKYNQLVGGIIQMYTTAVNNVSPEAVTSMADGQHLADTLYPQGVGLPPGFYYKGGYHYSPLDTMTSILVGSFWSSVPEKAIGIDVRTPFDASGNTSTNPALCRRLVSRLTSLYKPGGDLLEVVFSTVSSATRVVVSNTSFPISSDTPNCTYPRLFFVFRVQQ